MKIARLRRILPHLSIIIITLVVYGQVGDFEFTNCDDPFYIYNNPIVYQGITLHGLKWALFTSHYDFWHPLTWWSHMLDCQLFGLRPGPPHWVNVALHATNSVLMF